MNRFDKRTVIVTGGARGMGANHARGFVAEGANVVIADILEQEGRTLTQDLGDQAIFSRLDVTSEEDWAATLAAAEDAFGPVSVLINNAGIARFGVIEETEPGYLAPSDRDQPDRLVSRDPCRGVLDAEGGRRRDRQHLLWSRLHRHVRGRRVRGQQVGSTWADQDGGAGTRARQHPRQLGSPRRYPHADARRPCA